MRSFRPNEQPGRPDPDPGECRAAAQELVQELVRVFKVRRLYGPSHPQRLEVETTAAARIQALLESAGPISLGVDDEGLKLGDEFVAQQPAGPDSIAWLLHREGLRQITFYPGIESAELAAFLDHVAAVAMEGTHSGGQDSDLVARLWSEPLVHLRYIYVEQLADEEWSPSEIEAEDEPWEAGPPIELRAEDVDAVEFEGPSVLQHADAALYLLDQDELDRLHAELDAERTLGLHEELLTLVLELLMEPVHDDPTPLLGAIAEIQAATLARDEFDAVIALHAVFEPYLERGPGQDGREAFAGLRRAALAPPLLARLASRVETGEITEDDAAGYYVALGAGNLDALLTAAGDLKKLCQRPAFAAAFTELAGADPEAVVRALAGEDPVAGGAAAVLAGLVADPRLIEALGAALGSPDPALRREALLALKHFPGDRAVGLIAGAIDDPEPTIRVYALRHVTARRYTPALPRVSQLVEASTAGGLPIAERRLVYEAYGTLGGAEVVDRLAEPFSRRWLRKPDPEAASCAVVGLAATRTSRAREIVEKATGSKSVLVRRIAEQALGEWESARERRT